MTFRVGQKVAFVGPDCSSFGRYYGMTVAIRGAIYTIRGSRVMCCGRGYVFEEIVNPEVQTLLDGIVELHFDEKWLRPLVEPKSEVSFTHGADPSSDQFDNRRRVKVGAPA